MSKGAVKKVVKKEMVMHRENVIREFVHHHPLNFHIEGPFDDADYNPELRMPTDFKKLPFVLPKTVDDHEKVNRILKFSLREQKAHEISESPAVVIHLVSRCLTAINVKHRIAYGFRRVFPEKECRKSNDMEFPAAPHVWLIINKHIIDNTYMKIMPEKNYKYVIDNTPHCYEEADYADPSATMQEEIPLNCRPRGEMKKRIDFCMKWPDKALALNQNNEHFYNYFFSMIRYMYETYDVSVNGIDPNIRLICWGCDSRPPSGKDLFSDTWPISRTKQNLENGESVGQEATKSNPDVCSSHWRFQQCSQCMVASYCSTECQRRHWNSIHYVTCLPRGAVYL